MQKNKPQPKRSQEVLYTDNIQRKRTKQGKYINEYLKVKTIGEGPFSKIKLYIDSKNNKKVAIKKYNLFILKKKTKMERGPDGEVKYCNQADQVRKEIEIMKIPNHQNVAKTYEILDDKKEEKVYIVMDYCEYGDIANWNHKVSRFELNKQFIKSFPFFKDAFLQIAKGLEYLHSINIVHRDLKPLNILVDHNRKVKIIDFGRSVLLKNSQQKLKGSQGTYHFMAPQQLSELYPEGYDGKKSDIWALGISFYGILFGKLPFYHELMIKLFDMIEAGKYSFPEQCEKYCQPFKPVIKKMLSVDPEKRYTASELVTVLEKLTE